MIYVNFFISGVTNKMLTWLNFVSTVEASYLYAYRATKRFNNTTKKNKMKTTFFKMNALAYIAAVMMIFSMSSCATKNRFLNSAVLPAAQGTVQINKDKNQNYVIKIELSNLSPSTRLTPPASAYVVWFVTADNYTRNLGQLNSSTNFMSKNLDATFETVSATKPTRILITAENDVTVQQPSMGEPILMTDFLK